MNTNEMQEEQAPNQDAPQPKHRSLLHIQVSGNPSPDRLALVADMFQRAAHDPKGAVVTTPDDVTVFNVLIPMEQPLVPLLITGAVSPELIAQTAWAVKRAFWRAQGEGLGNWQTLSEEEKAPMRVAVQNVLRFQNMTPAQLHTQWMRQMVDAGWVYGPELNVELKKHPEIVPYAGLHEARRTWDAMFKALVEAMRARLPAPSNQMRATQLYLEAKQSFIDIDFSELQPNNVWRFTDAPEQLYIATSEPYLQFTENVTALTIDANPLVVQQEQPQDQEQANDQADANAEQPAGEAADLDGTDGTHQQ